MLCCGLGVALAATAGLSWRRRKAAVLRHPAARLAIAAMAASTTLIFSAFAAQHFGHYVDRARANERTLLAEIMAQPLCSGAPPSEQATLTVADLDGRTSD